MLNFSLWIGRHQIDRIICSVDFFPQCFLLRFFSFPGFFQSSSTSSIFFLVVFVFTVLQEQLKVSYLFLVDTSGWTGAHWSGFVHVSGSILSSDECSSVDSSGSVSASVGSVTVKPGVEWQILIGVTGAV